MSFLTPLYALGFLAIAAPIVFHLIRRMPRGEVPGAASWTSGSSCSCAPRPSSCWPWPS
jgi:hypothetical protein